jgi:hypothetical protein
MDWPGKLPGSGLQAGRLSTVTWRVGQTDSGGVLGPPAVQAELVGESPARDWPFWKVTPIASGRCPAATSDAQARDCWRLALRTHTVNTARGLSGYNELYPGPFTQGWNMQFVTAAGPLEHSECMLPLRYTPTQ